MDTPITQNPFAALTFVAAPALLTNASSVLAMSTINRMLRTRERMHELLNASESMRSEVDASHMLEMVNRVETQAALLMRALHSIYVALSSFASGTLVTLLGAGFALYRGPLWVRITEWIGFGLGLAGVSGLVVGCANLFQATRLSLINIREEASIVRERLTPINMETADD